MKRIVLVIALLAAIAAQGQSEWNSLPRNSVSVSPVSLIMGIPSVTYERWVAQRWAVDVHLAAKPFRSSSPYGVSTALDLRWYFGYAKPMLFFVEGGFYGAYAWMTRDFFVYNDGFDIYTKPYTFKEFTMRLSLMAGWRLQSHSGFMMEMRAGFLPGKDGPIDFGNGVAYYPMAMSYFPIYWGLKFGWAF